MKTLFTIPLTVFSFFFAAAQAPVNDDCAGIVDLGEVPYCSQPAQFTNLNATTSIIDGTANVPSCWNNVGDRDVWFQFSLPANGSIVDISIAVWGNVAGNGTLEMPQLAVYRGDCEFGGLAESGCITAALNVNELKLDLFGLTPGVPYFLRINDFSDNASPNSGTFKLCVGPYEPDINIGDAPGSSSCSGTLWDSGGPDGDYQTDEYETFVICPTEFHQCIKLNFASFNIESDYDFIRVYEGNNTGGTLLKTIDGAGSNLELQLSSNCVTIEFESDGSIELEGFQMTWLCSPEVCDAPPPVLPSNATCDQALNINGCDNGPEIIPLSPGAGDPNFLQTGLNQGCFDLTSLGSFNHSFFYFQAEANGKFGFAVQSANPNEASDIDFNVWGPINSVAEICDFVSNNQPIRSSWAAEPDLTGLADVHPVTGLPINDEFDCGSPFTPGPDPPPPPFVQADDFVSRIDVQTGQIYVIMLDDFGGNIQENGIDIDFSGTSDGVLGLPDASITVSNDTFSCNAAPIQLQITGGLSFSWTPSTGLSCNDCPNPIASPSQTTTYEVKVVDVCQSLTETVTVSIGPSLNVRNDTAICNGQSVLLGNTVPQTGVTYTWTPNDGSLSDPSAANPTATPLQTTVYTLTATAGPCSATRVVTIAVVQLDLELSVQDTSICRGKSLEISASANPPTSINWSPLTQLQVQPGGMSAVATPTSNIVYNVTASLPGCMRKETVTIQVDNLPMDLSITPSDTLVCGGDQVLLLSPSYSGALFPDLQFEWQTTAGQIFPDSQYFFLANTSETTIYQRITTNGACVDTASAIINVIPVPVLTINPANPKLCIGESTPLVVGNAVGLTNPLWSPPIGLNCIACTSTTAAPASTTTYQFTADVANGCTATVSVIVEVNQPPQYQFPKDTLCAGESILLNLIADSTVSYTWTSNPPGFFSFEAQPRDTLQQTTTFLVTMENGCTVQEQFVVQVIPAGSLMVGDGDTVCAGVSAQLTASGNYPGTYAWSHGATGQVVSVTPVQSTTYTVTYSYPLPNVQCQLLDSVIVNVQGAAAQVKFPTDTLLCPGDSVLLNSLATPGATYTWTSDPPIFASNDSIPPVFYPEESATYTVTTMLGICSVSYNVDITVFNPKMVVSKDTAVCSGEPLTIGAEAFLTGDYLWSPGGAVPTFVDTVTANRQYTLRFEYGEGCLFEDTVNVTVIPNFTLKLISDPDTNRIHFGDPILLDAFVPGTNVSNFIFDWLENTLPVGSTQQITVTPMTTDSTVTYWVTVMSPLGCVQTQSITFTIIQPTVKIPNAFTPNGDGANDSFGLAIIEGVVTVEKMEVYSRWGQKVFASSEPNARWDGTIDGKDAPSDVYVYVIFYREGDGALAVEKGEVTLLR